MTTIYILEDNPVITKVLRNFLSKSGFGVEVFDRGDSALEAIKAKAPDLLISDIMVPGITGADVVEAMKQDDGLKDIPIVMLTAAANAETRDRLLELGVAKYVTKNELVLAEFANEIKDMLS